MNTRMHRQREEATTRRWTLRRIGAAVMVRRLEIALGRSDLAARIGVPTATVDAIENGRYDPRVVLAPRLETALAMTPGSIDQTGGGNPPRPRPPGHRDPGRRWR